MRSRPLNPSTLETPLRGAAYLSAEELARAVGISPASLARLVRLGLVEATVPGVGDRSLAVPVFTAATAARLRRMFRLHVDLGVNFIGTAIIVDLLERLDRREAELARLRGRS